ncbi:MAG: Cna B-type domain-containing protein [Clostridia bacterium]|nr:Cna B-type domain-containing protein [Clostridia bacterium]
MKNKTALKAMAMLIITVMCITLFSFGTSAVSLDTKGSITLTTLDKETKEPISGAVFRVYRFAYAYASGEGIAYTYTDEFKNNGMDMGDFSDAYLPIHLSVYAQMKSLSYIEKSTDSTGKVTFDNLPCGAYLVVPAGASEGYLNPTPFIVAVPMRDSVQNKWVYDVDATPKIESDKDEDAEKIYISVKKYWKTDEKTPDRITVSLIMDGVIADSVILGAENNWYFKWENLDKNHSWSVIEADVPEGYKVSYITSQMTVIITNTDTEYEDETTTVPEDTTSPDDTTVPEDTTDDDGTTKPTQTTKPTGENESTTKPEELIDTGQLNWPVPVLSIAGLLIFSAGWVLLNFGKKDEEAV